MKDKRMVGILVAIFCCLMLFGVKSGSSKAGESSQSGAAKPEAEKPEAESRRKQSKPEEATTSGGSSKT